MASLGTSRVTWVGPSNRARRPTTTPGASTHWGAIVHESPMMAPRSETGITSPSTIMRRSPWWVTKWVRITVPSSMTELATYEEPPMETLLWMTLLRTSVNGAMTTLLPMEVDGNTTTLGPMSQPSPITAGPRMYDPLRMTVPRPMETGPWMTAPGSTVPAVRAAVFWSIFALTERMSHG